MPDEPVYKEFGKPMAADPTKTSDEIFNSKYGTYKETGTWHKSGTAANPASKLDPKPFSGTK